MTTLTGKTIGQLTTLSAITDNTLFPVEFSGKTFHIPYSAFTNAVTGVTFNGQTNILTISSENAPNVSTLINRYNRWYIPSGYTYTVENSYQSFIFGDLVVEGTIDLQETGKLVVLNGNLNLSGGTIIGSGTTSVISLPEYDTFLTGGTYNSLTESIDFSGNSSASTFTVDVSQLLDDTNTYTTGYTYQDNNFTIFDNSGNTFNTTIDVVTGLTINGNLTVTGDTSLQGLTATTISGGTYYGDGSNLSGLVTGYSYSQINNYTSGVPLTITHNLDTTEVVVQIVNTNTNELIFGNISNYQTNSLDVTLSSSLNGIKVIVIGSSLVSLTPNGYTTMLFGHDSISPNDSTTYYIGGQFNLSPITSSNDGRRLISQITGNITEISISRIIGGTLGSSELNTFIINNVTQSISSTITTTATFDSSTSLLNYILPSPLSVVSGDKIEIQWSTPIFATNPTTVRQQINVLIQY